MSGAAAIRPDVLVKVHARYFQFHLNALPKPYQSLDTNRLMVVYFALSALDILGQLYPEDEEGLGKIVTEDRKAEIIEWVYRQQVVLTDKNGQDCGGFIGGGFCGSMENPQDVGKYHQSHVSMTYCALLILTILGDDLSRVDKDAAIRGVRALQQADGSFQAVGLGTESDMRFVFCAAAVCFMLQDWSGMDVDKAAAFIASSQTFDGGFGILPGQEAHAGAIYTAVAALKLMGRLDVISDRKGLEEFLIFRQSENGYNGRLNKVPDSCYSFWVQAPLKMLGMGELRDANQTRKFLMTCQSAIGGFCKYPCVDENGRADILHSYYSICGLSLAGEPGFRAIDGIGLTERACKSSQFHDGRTGSGQSYFNF